MSRPAAPGQGHDHTRSPALVGQTIAERYRLEDLIAIGGMSEVWHATDTRTGVDVAVKLLRHDLVGDPRFLRRLRMEARNTARLRHRNLVSLLDHGERDGTGYLVQEYVQGETLASILARKGSMTPEQIVPILCEALHGLGAAHAAGVVHRDVKPGNVLITRSGTVKLSDFGISFGADQPRLTSTGMVMGTAEYLSPEQATGKQATAQSDVYAVGIIAHEALAGRRPFTGRTQVDVALAQVEREPAPLPASVPVPLRTAVLRLLAKDPAARPDGARAAADLLHHAWSTSTHPPRQSTTPEGATATAAGDTGAGTWKRERTAPPPPPPGHPAAPDGEDSPPPRPPHRRETDGYRDAPAQRGRMEAKDV